MASAKDVANVFLRLSEPETGDFLTNLKVQKLVYYAQGFHLAIFNGSLFGENILHWDHGPVVKELYDRYKRFGDGPLPVPKSFTPSMFNSDELALLKDINNVYGQFSAWKLRDMTHNERPWIETVKDEIIGTDLLKEYFSTLLA